MTDRQRLNESISVRLTSDDRKIAESFSDGDCSGLLRLAGRVFSRALTLLQEDIRTNLGGKNARVIEGGEVALMSAVVRVLWSGQWDTQLDVQRVGDWWVWLAVDGLMLRYGGVPVKVKGKEQPFAIAIKYSKTAESPTAVEFWEWLEIERIGRAWTFGEVLDG